MTVFEWGMAAAFFAGGVRSLWVWIRRPFESHDLTDQVLYALFRTGRIGLWFAFSGLFTIYATRGTQGRAFADDVREFNWYLGVILLLSAMQFVASYFLGRRDPESRVTSRERP